METIRNPPDTGAVITQTLDAGTVRIHIPRRTPEREQAFQAALDRVIRKAIPGRRLVVGR